MNPTYAGHKQETIAAYNAFPERFDAEFESHMRRYNMEQVLAFLDALRGTHVLDIGSGPGNYADLFVAQGLETVCGDISQAMVDACRAKGLQAELMDLETFDLKRRFDGVWANACLLHLPKIAVSGVLERIARHLAPSGIFACTMKEGEGERFLPDVDYPGTRRFYSYFKDEEFRTLLAPRFEVFRHERTVSRTGSTVFIKYLARLR